MGNTTNSNSAPPSPSSSSRWTINRQNSTTKQIHISTDHADGFYFTGDRLTGTVKIPTSFVHRHLHNINNQTPAELLHKRSLRSAIIIELVGDATYSSEVDVAADSDGHATHKVNLCRHRCIVTLNQNKPESEPSTSSDPNALGIIRPPPELNGIFQLDIPDHLPPSLTNARTPSVVYTLELSLSSSRYRYQIPIILSSRGCIPYPMTDIEINDSAINKYDIRLCAYLSGSFYRPGEQIPVRINYSNPQQRFVRSITIRLVQFYRIHNDQNRLQLDGKEWTFDILTMLPQREWTGEARLQLPNQPLPASYSTNTVGTTQAIECELDYRIIIELSEKKGDEIQLTLPSIQLTYQK
jgi:hypothetical protein